MSSNSRRKGNFPLLISRPMAVSPLRIALASAFPIMRCAASIWACASEPSRSWTARRLSMSMETLIASMMAAGPLLKRPPHILLVVMRLAWSLFARDVELMMSRARLIYILVASAAAIGLPWLLYEMRARDVNASASPPAVLNKLELTEGTPLAPAVTFYDKDDKAMSLNDFRGRYVLVNLWATWC